MVVVTRFGWKGHANAIAVSKVLAQMFKRGHFSILGLPMVHWTLSLSFIFRSMPFFYAKSYSPVAPVASAVASFALVLWAAASTLLATALTSQP